MHFAVLMAIEIPKAKEAIPVPTGMDEIVPRKNESIPDDMFDSALVKALEVYEKLFAGRSDFEAYVTCLADAMLAPYCQNTDNPDYLSFWDETDAGLEKYENGHVDFVKTPDGRVIERGNYEFSRKYEVFEGQVYRKEFGKLHHRKRTKKAKQFQLMPSRSFKEIYPTFDDFMKDWWGADYDERTGRYGYYYNPNSMWDWYQVGGRWPYPFLSKKGLDFTVRCKPSILSGDTSEKPAPDDYQWVTGARKCDIQWDMMLELYRKEHKERFQQYEKWLAEGKIPQEDAGYYRISEDSIVCFGDIVHCKGETEEEYLQKIGLDPECQYPVNVAAILDAEGMQSMLLDVDMADYYKDDKVKQTWRKRVHDFITKQPDDVLLLSVDCHT